MDGWIHEKWKFARISGCKMHCVGLIVAVQRDNAWLERLNAGACAQRPAGGSLSMASGRSINSLLDRPAGVIMASGSSSSSLLDRCNHGHARQRQVGQSTVWWTDIIMTNLPALHKLSPALTRDCAHAQFQHQLCSHPPDDTMNAT